MGKVEEVKINEAAQLASEIVNASEPLLKHAGAQIVVLISFTLDTGHASALSANTLTEAPRMLATALEQIPGGPAYIKLRADEQIAEAEERMAAANATKQ